MKVESKEGGVKMVDKKVKIKRIIIAICVCFSVAFLLWIYDYYDNLTIKLPKDLETLIDSELQKWEYPNKVSQLDDIEFTAISKRVIKIEETKEQTVVYGEFCIMSYSHGIIEDIRDTNDFTSYSDGYQDYIKIYVKKNNQGESYISDIWYPTGEGYYLKIMKEFPITTWTQTIIHKKRNDEVLTNECINQVKDYILNTKVMSNNENS